MWLRIELRACPSLCALAVRWHTSQTRGTRGGQGAGSPAPHGRRSGAGTGGVARVRRGNPRPPSAFSCGRGRGGNRPPREGGARGRAVRVRGAGQAVPVRRLCAQRGRWGVGFSCSCSYRGAGAASPSRVQLCRRGALVCVPGGQAARGGGVWRPVRCRCDGGRRAVCIRARRSGAGIGGCDASARRSGAVTLPTRVQSRACRLACRGNVQGRCAVDQDRGAASGKPTFRICFCLFKFGC